MITRFRVIAILIPVILTTLLLFPFQVLAVRYDWQFARKIPVLWHRITARLIGLTVHKRGVINPSRPLMLVANHISWTDIVILSSLGEVSFIAKQEVASSFFKGILAKLQRTIFINRDAKRQAGDQSRDVAQRLIQGDIVVLFPEGTTGTGNKILPFKSALFGAAQMALKENHEEPVTIQPVSIAYTHCHGVRAGRLERQRISWPGDVALGPHLKQLVLRGPWDVEVTFCEPITFDEKAKRREIAAIAHERVVEGYWRSVKGE